MPRKVQIAEASSDENDMQDNDTEQEEEQPAPQRRRSGARKSLGNEASFIAELPNRPAAVDINDDLAEKRRRRKSTKIPQEASMAGPSADAESSNAARAKKRLTIVQPPVINVAKDVMNTNFDQWMKMHTDGKITAANSWDVFLIDYFHEGSLLRNTDDDTINFQKASYTLEGCVKIWTSRVDSVGTDSAKLASNLASGRNVDAEDESGDEGIDGGDPSQPKRKRNHRSTATLKEPSQLRSKKIETEFLVDPLFKKTCADFDEGGAQGLLMNHLSLGVGKDGGLRVVFDAGDSLSKGDEENDEDEPLEEVDISGLRRDYLPDLSILDGLEICPDLNDFSFRKEGNRAQHLSMVNDFSAYTDDEEAPQEAPTLDIDQPEQDFFASAEGDDDDGPGDDWAGDGGGEYDDNGGGDYQGGDFGGGGDGGGEHANVSITRESNQRDGAGGQDMPFDASNTSNDRTLMVTMDGHSGMDHFDNDNSRNWAGPEHFRPRLGKLFRKSEKDAAKPKVTRQKKEAVKIDFSTPPDQDLDDVIKTLFAKGKPGAISLPKKTKEKKSDHRLPDDMHFTSRQLISLFLKPKFTLTMRGRKGPEPNQEIDENFWAQAAADQAAGRTAGDDEMGQAGPDGATQFLDDDDDAPAFDDGFDGIGFIPEQEEEDLLASTQNQAPRVRPPTVNYAKRAKRVDVKKLKDNIWKGLDIVTPHMKKEDGMDVDEDEITDPSDARTFGSVISDLQASYPKERMDDISTSFCFICLLHLANEQGLRLEDEEQEEDRKERISQLWDVKVYRDPDAIPAA